MQYSIWETAESATHAEPKPIHKTKPFTQQLLKWVGNKQRFAHEIIQYFPSNVATYFEPFLGSGGVLGTLAPANALASDSFAPLMEIWKTLKEDPETLTAWYEDRWLLAKSLGKQAGYEKIKADYNRRPNGPDFLFLTRACYGGIVRFRKADGYMSTPCGVHTPIPPENFSKRVAAWHPRVRHTTFERMEYTDAMDKAKPGDLIYCDPPYSFSQAILYGAQSFSLATLFEKIAECKKRNVFVALSIDGTKKSGDLVCDVKIPTNLFEREIFVKLGRSMLRRFQLAGRTLEKEIVADRLLLTY